MIERMHEFHFPCVQAQWRIAQIQRLRRANFLRMGFAGLVGAACVVVVSSFFPNPVGSSSPMASAQTVATVASDRAVQ